MSLSAGEISGFRSIFLWHLSDTCQILTAVITYNALNEPTTGFTTGSAITCGFRYANSSDVRRPDLFPLIVDAVIRLPWDTVVSELDRVKLTKRYGIALTTPEVYDLVGIPMLGPAGKVANLKEAVP